MDDLKKRAEAQLRKFVWTDWLPIKTLVLDLYNALNASNARSKRLADYVRADLSRRRLEAITRQFDEGTPAYRASDREAQDALAQVWKATGELQPGDLGESEP